MPHSERANGELHLGKHPATPLRPGAVRYGELRQQIAKAGISLPPVPMTFGHGGDFRDWRMLGNGPDDTVFPGFQGCGDCAWAGPAHEEMEAAHNCGRPPISFSGKTVVSQYSAYSGYDPTTGQNDTGSNVQDVITHRQTHGLLDDRGHAYKIGQAVWLNAGDLAQLWEAAYLFECVGIGVVITTANMDQFDAGQPWDYAPGSPEEGGHYIPVIGRASADNGGLITWAERHGFTRKFYESQCDEAVAYIDNERYSTVTGKTAEHYTDQDLELYLSAVGKLKAAA
jgi:hypothetical protein